MDTYYQEIRGLAKSGGKKGDHRDWKKLRIPLLWIILNSNDTQPRRQSENVYIIYPLMSNILCSQELKISRAMNCNINYLFK